MNWYEIVLGVVLIAVSVLIVVFTLAQEQKVTKMKRVRQALWLCKQRPGGPFFVDVYKGRAPSDGGAT